MTAPHSNLAAALRERANTPRFRVSVPLGPPSGVEPADINLASVAVRIVDPAAEQMGPDLELVAAADRIAALEAIVADLRRALKLPRTEISAMEIGAIRNDMTVLLDALDRWHAVRSRVSAFAVGHSNNVLFQFPAIGAGREVLRGSVAQHLDRAIDGQLLDRGPTCED
jgi:hypothetical protein